MFHVLDYDVLKKTALQREGVRLYIPKRLIELKEYKGGVQLLCEGWEYRKDSMDIWFNQLNPCLTPTGEKREMVVGVEVIGPHVLRIRLLMGSQLHTRVTPMIHDPYPFEERSFSLIKGEEAITLTTERLKVLINREPLQLKIEDREGHTLLEQYNQDPHAITELIKEQGEAQDDFSNYLVYPFGLAYDLCSGMNSAFDAIRMGYDEAFYGFGEKYSSINKRGQDILCWHTDSLGTSSQKSYKNIPFFMSSKGYGIFLNTICRSRYRMGDTFFKAYQLESCEEELDYYFFYGPLYRDILKSYTELTGRSPLPPKWSFGIWMSRNSYRSQEEVLTVAKSMRERELPCDVLHLDVDWFKEPFICDFTFDESRFPDPHAMLQEMEEMGFHMSIWQLPYVSKKSSLYREGQEKGYFEKYSHPANTEAMIDLSNPEASKWYEEMLRSLLKLGFSAIKADFGDGVEVKASYSKYSGEEIHNLYPLLYNQLVFELTKTIHGEKEGIIWARSAYAGSQRYPVHWGGDSDSDFSSLASTLRGGLSLGLSGFSFWSHDIGGYYTTPTKECYIRWLQVGMFSSHVRFHGVTSREPWVFGEEAVKIYKKYGDLRYRLLPYIYSQAKKCSDEGLPLLRPLILEYPFDRNLRHIDDEYLFGDHLLVAPILTEEEERMVYLPKGEWLSFWDRKPFKGGEWFSYKAPLDHLPLFIQKGSILPMGPPMQYVGERKRSPLTFHIYHHRREEYDYYDDEESFHLLCEEREGRLYVELGETQCTLEICIYGVHKIRGIEDSHGEGVEYTLLEDILTFWGEGSKTYTLLKS